MAATPITISIPHQLGRAEARRRIEGGLDQLTGQIPGGLGLRSPQWEGDRLTFGIQAMGQTAQGAVEVFDATVTIEIELPGMLGMLAGHLKGSLQRAGQLLLTKK
jgi:putative polyhydroxyalkanoate system protein